MAVRRTRGCSSATHSSLTCPPATARRPTHRTPRAHLATHSAFPWEYTHHTLAGVDPPYESDNFVSVGFEQNDGNYHVYSVDWVPGVSAQFYVDGKAGTKVTGAKLVPDFGHLVLAAWFPNAWAGSPTFDTCQMMVDYVKITANDA